ncbi:MAG: hypothetical protein ACFFD7_10160 [Candidatus Thorarchaeota archaeon]
MSKGFDLNNLITSWEKEGTLDYKKKVLGRVPKRCLDCKSTKIDYKDETEEEIIFQCIDCKRIYPIPYDKDKNSFYFFS